MRTLVTGGAGFIGSAIVDALIADSADVLIVDDLSTGTEANLHFALGAGAELVELDVRQRGPVDEAFRSFRPDLVFHLAAQIDVRKSITDPAFDASVNVLGSINVFAAADAVCARRVVNTSTGGAIYGEMAPVPTPESERPDPLSAYGLSKLTVERYASWFCRAYGLDTVTLRYGNVYGPRQDPSGDAGVIALFCDRALAGRRPTVYGDGTQTRDYVFVTDVVAANLAAARVETPKHRVYNIGTGIEVSVLQLAAAVAAAAGVPMAAFAPDFAPARPGELARSCLAVDRARHALGLGAPVALTDGLRATLAWLSQC